MATAVQVIGAVARGAGIGRTLLVLGLIALPATPSRAQVVRGTVTAAETGVPLEGAFVVLLDERGERRAGSLTPADGTFLLRAPAAGRYRLVVERIGFQNAGGELFELRSGETLVRDISAATRAISLEGLSVQGERRCGADPGRGVGTARIWDEARKALSVAAWADASELMRYEVTLFERQLDARGRRVLFEDRRRRSGLGRHAFESLPAERLEAEGFVRDASEGREYFAPDAAVLLSDAFLRTHCFTVVSEGERIGLEFEPLPDRRLPDIAGTIWMDVASARLERLEFTYVGAHDDLSWPQDPFARRQVGGEVEFEQLPTGVWIVRRWAIRMPVVASRQAYRRRDGTVREVTGLHEVGGTVTRAVAGGRTLVAPSRDRGSVRGVAWDSTTHQPLDEAVVFLSGTAYGGRSAPDGSFAIADVREGEYELVLEHPRQRALGIVPPKSTVSVRAGAVVRADVAVPSYATLVERHCGPEVAAQGHATILGSVVDADAGRAVAGATVDVVWFRYVDPGGGLVEEREGVTVVTDRQGHFAACGIPANRRTEVVARIGNEDELLRSLGLLSERQVIEVVLEIPRGG